MKSSPDATSKGPALLLYADRREHRVERAPVEPPAERPSFDLLNALLPEWPAQACTWA